jgi:hypothetical protein
MDQGLAIAHGFAAYNAAFLGSAEDALPAIERAMRLDQADRRHSIWFFFGGFAELLMGRTDASICVIPEIFGTQQQLRQCANVPDRGLRA